MLDPPVTYHIHHQNPLPPNNALAYQYILAGNGVFVRAETRFWTALAPVARATVRGLAALGPQFRLRVPRLPAGLLAAVLADARRRRRPDGELNEALYHFHHDGRRVRVTRPRQRATAVTVQATGGAGPDVVCELHSHGQMPAFWSETDNVDERGARLYAVIGRLTDRPEIRLRVGVYGHWLPLPITAVFNGPGGFVDRFGAASKDINVEETEL